MVTRYGASALEQHFRSFDTICSATQDLQDAALALGQGEPLDLVLVLGGHNSSNTGHLLEICSEFALSFHLDGPEALGSKEHLVHQALGAKETSVATDWLPEGPVRVGVTAGASTSDRTVGEVIERLLALRGLSATSL